MDDGPRETDTYTAFAGDRHIASGPLGVVLRATKRYLDSDEPGTLLIFDDQTWLLFRLSGTEPVARVYAEACSPKDLKNLLDAGKKFVAPA